MLADIGSLVGILAVLGIIAVIGGILIIKFLVARTIYKKAKSVTQAAKDFVTPEVKQLVNDKIAAAMSRFETSGGKNAAGPPQPLTSAPKAGSIADNLKILKDDPDLATSNPVLFKSTNLSITQMCSNSLGRVDVSGAIRSMAWIDNRIAATARAYTGTGVQHGEVYCELVGGAVDDDTAKHMEYLHSMAALVCRVDRDLEMTMHHNIKRLQYIRNPDELTDRGIEGMIADAELAGGPPRAAEMLMLFSNLADEKPEWERLTPRLRKILGTD